MNVTFTLIALLAASTFAITQCDYKLLGVCWFIPPVHESIFIAKEVIMHGEYSRMVLSLFYHHGIVHLVVNASTLFLHGLFLEPYFGSVQFLLIIVMLSVMSQCTHMALLVLMENAYPYVKFTELKATGFSGVLFGMSVLEDRIKTGGFRMVLLELILSHVLFSNASLTGHISGIASGLVVLVFMWFAAFAKPFLLSDRPKIVSISIVAAQLFLFGLSYDASFKGYPMIEKVIKTIVPCADVSFVPGHFLHRQKCLSLLFSPREFFSSHECVSFLLSPMFHSDAVQLLCGMASLLFNGTILEEFFGSSKYLATVIALIVLTQGVFVCVGLLGQSHWLMHFPRLRYEHAFVMAHSFRGFTGVICGMKCLILFLIPVEKTHLPVYIQFFELIGILYCINDANLFLPAGFLSGAVLIFLFRVTQRAEKTPTRPDWIDFSRVNADRPRQKEQVTGLLNRKPVMPGDGIRVSGEPPVKVVDSSNGPQVTKDNKGLPPGDAFLHPSAVAAITRRNRNRYLHRDTTRSKSPVVRRERDDMTEYEKAVLRGYD
jgi:membrane associated rhomboid family serine protease